METTAASSLLLVHCWWKSSGEEEDSSGLVDAWKKRCGMREGECVSMMSGSDDHGESKHEPVDSIGESGSCGDREDVRQLQLKESRLTGGLPQRIWSCYKLFKSMDPGIGGKSQTK
jgi:hypothetical protein